MTTTNGNKSKMKNVVIFDLDETVIDSRHRTPNNADGTLNLAAYLEMQTPENIAKDTLLPLANVMKQRRKMGDYIIVLTARGMSEADYQFLADNGLEYNKILSRNNISEKHYKMKDGEYKALHIKKFMNLKQFKKAQFVMFDDAKPVKSVLRKMFPVICAHKANRKVGV